MPITPPSGGPYVSLLCIRNDQVVGHQQNLLQAGTTAPFSVQGERPMSTIAAQWKSRKPSWLVFVAVGAVALLLAFAATPNLMRSRVPAEESAALSQLRSAIVQKGETAATASVSLPTNGLIAAEQAAGAPPPIPSATVDRKIVRTGALELTVQNPAEAAEKIRFIAESMGGYLESAQIGGTKDAPFASLTIRVPAAQFEAAKAGIRKLAARVDNETIGAQDVTRQYVDMEARIRNLRAEEAQYLTIMKSAYKVDDLLQVSEKLSEVRGEIEQQQAEFQTLSKQVETVAITVTMRALADAQVFGLNWRPLYQLKVAARNGLDALADFAATMTGVLFYLPVVLAWTVTLFFTGLFGWRLIRWTGKTFFAWPPASAEKATAPIQP
jgi:hypothetical protein